MESKHMAVTNFIRTVRHSLLARYRTSTLETAGAFGVMMVLASILYAPALFWGKFLLLRDLHSQFYGPRCWYRECLLAGQLPHWNPYILCGVPFLANPQNSVFYPFTLIFLVLPATYGFAVVSALHSALLGFFSYLLGRALGLSFWGALLAGIAAGFAGIPIKQIEFPEMAAGFAWTPLALLGAWQCLTRPGPRAAAILGTAIGLQLLAGSPYPPFYSAVGILCALAVRAGSAFFQRSPATPAGAGWPRRIAALGGGLLCGVLTGCIQYVPTLWLIRSTPSEALSGILPLKYSLRVRDFLHLVSPWLGGFPNWQKCFYVGIAPLLFATIAVYAFFAMKKKPMAEAERPALALAAERLSLCCLLIFSGGILAQAGYLKLDRLLDCIPLVTRATKWPTLGMSLVVLGVALLAGAGMDYWFDPRRPAGRRSSRILAALAGLFTLAIALDAIRGGAWLEPVRKHLYQQMVPYLSTSLDLSNFPLAHEAGRMAWCGAALTAIFMAGSRNAWLAALRPAVCVLAAADLLTAWTGLNFYASENLYLEKPGALRPILASLNDERLGRVAVPQIFDLFNGFVYGSKATDEFQTLRNLLIDDTLMPWKVFSTQGAGSVQLPDYQYHLQSVLDYLMNQQTPAADGVLGAWNVAFIMQHNPDAEADKRFSIRINRYALQRVRLLEQVVPLAKEEDVYYKIGRCDWDPRTVLAATDQAPLMAAAEHFAVNEFEAPGRVAHVAYTPNHISVICVATRPCILVLAENWAEGWSVQVDETPAALYRVNYLQQAVLLPQGAHQVVFRYAAPGLLPGMLLTGLGVLGLGAGALCRPKAD